MYQIRKILGLLSIPTGMLTILLATASLPTVAVTLPHKAISSENSARTTSVYSQYQGNKNNIHTKNPANGRLDSNR